MADAFFRFGTNIDATADDIRAGMQRIAQSLASARGVNVNMFDAVSEAATAAAVKANRELAKIGNNLGAGINRGTLTNWTGKDPATGKMVGSGPGPTIQAQYNKIKADGLKGVEAEIRARAAADNLSAKETSALVREGQRQVRLKIDELFREISTALATEAKVFQRGKGGIPRLDATNRPIPNVTGFLRGDVGRATTGLYGREGNENLVRRTGVGSSDAAALKIEEQLRKEAEVLDARHNAQKGREQTLQLGENRRQTAIERSITRHAEKLEREQARRVKQAETQAIRDNKAFDQARLYERVASDPTTRQIGNNRYVQGSTGQVYNTRGAGLEEEVNRGRVTRAYGDLAKSIQSDINDRAKANRQASLSQSFLGGLTSAGFGSHSAGFDASGLARSLGSTVKFSTQYAALQLVQTAFRDTISEAVDYRDSLTDLNVALGQSNKASASYVDSLSDISKLAGGNVGQALDSAARGVRAFGDGLDDAGKKQAGVEVARAATSLSIIANKAIPDATGDLVAIGSAFGVGADNLERIVDAISAAKAQGGDPKQISQGLANGGVALQEAGFSYTEAAQLLSRVVLKLDQSGQASATRISRITSALAGTAGRTLVRSLGVDPNGSQRDQLVAISSGLASNKYNAAQQAQIKSVLGGSSNLRELQVMLDAIGKELAGGFANGFDTAGKGQKEMDRRTSDLAGHLKILAGTITNIQNEIFDSGAFAPFVAALGTLQPVLGTVEELLKLFNQLSKAALPDFRIGGVGMQEVLVGGLEILAVTKALNVVRRRSVTDVGALAAMESDLAIARAGAARQIDPEIAAEVTAQRAHAAAAVAIEAEMAAYTGLTAARARSNALNIGSALSAGTREADALLPAGVVRRTATTARSRVGGFLASGAGKATVIGTAIVVATQSMLALKGAIEENTRAKSQGRGAIDDLSTGSVGSSIDALSSAATAADHASSGIVGNIVDDFNKLTGGSDLEKLAKDLRAERNSEQARVKRRKEEATAAAGTPGQFDDIFKDASMDSLKSGLEQLDAAGASATRTIALLNDALGGVGDAVQTGVIRPGSSGRIADDITSTLFPAVTNVLATPIEAAVGTSPSDNRLEYFYKHRAEILDRREKDQKALTDAGKKPLSDADSLLQANLEVQRENAGKAASDVLAGIPAFATGKRSKLLEDASVLLKNKIDKQVGPAGVLTEAQIQEDAALLADFLIGKDSSLKGSRDALIALLQGNIKDKTTYGGKLITQDDANFYANEQRTRSQTKRSERLDASYNFATGETNPLAADEGQIQDLQFAINKIKSAGLNVPDEMLHDLFNSYRQLVEDRLAETKKSIAILNAKDAAGIDPRDTKAQAAAGITAARRALAVARPGLEFYQAQAALLKAQQDYADEVTAARTTALFNNVDPRDEIGQAAAAVEANRIEQEALRKGQTTQSPLNDFDSKGNPVGLAPDVTALGKGTITSYAEGLKSVDLFQGGVDGATRLLQGWSSVFPETPPPATPPPAAPGGTAPAAGPAASGQKYITTVVGERPDGTQIKKQVPVPAPAPPTKKAAKPAAPAPPLTTGGAGNTKEADAKAQEGKRLQEAERQARLAYSVATLRSTTDPNNSLAQARTNLEIARRTLRTQLPNTRGYADALTEVHNQELNLAKTYAGIENAKGNAKAAQLGGAVAQATNGLSQAQRNLKAQAPQTEEWFNAQAQVYEQQRTLAQAQLDYSLTLLRLGSDITNPLEQAAIETRGAARKLREDIAKKAAPDVIATDRLNLKTAQANQESTAFSQNLQAAQTADQLGRTSHAAYLKYLQSEHDRLSAIKVKTYQQQQELDQIDGLIKGANDSLQGQFNLGDIKIPTPYEVRRSITSAAAGGGGGYSDNRTVSIVINGGNVDEVKAVIRDNLGSKATNRLTVSPKKGA